MSKVLELIYLKIEPNSINTLEPYKKNFGVSCFFICTSTEKDLQTLVNLSGIFAVMRIKYCWSSTLRFYGVLI